MRATTRVILLALIPLLAHAQNVSVPGGVTTVSSGGTNGALYRDASGNIISTATGGAGTLCYIEASGGVPTWGSCAGSASSVWSALSNPVSNLSLSMGANTTLFTYGAATGAATNPFSVVDTTSNTGTGALFNVNTATASALFPFQATARGTANGVQMSVAGALAAIGTGSIAANTVTGFSPTASKVLTLSNTLTFTGTDASSVAFGTGGTVLYNGGALGTPASGTGTNLTGIPISTGISGLGTGVATFLATASSANLLATLTTKTGTGLAMFGTSPTASGFTLSDVATGTQCLHANSSGVVSGTGSECGSGGGSSAFSALTSSTNTTAAMVVSTGASLGASGSGTIAATSVTGLSGLTSNLIPKATGAAALSNSSITDNGTTVSTTEPIAALSVSTGSSPPASAWFTGTAGIDMFGDGTCTGTVPASVSAVCDKAGQPFWLTASTALILTQGPSSTTSSDLACWNATDGSLLKDCTAIPSATTATTQSAGDNTTKLSTTGFVTTAVANAVAASNPATSVLAASTSSQTGTYSNGVSGVGATFTITATGAYTLDGTAINTIGQRVLLKNQSSAFQNGLYTATVVGTTGVSAVFTRALDYDQSSDINNTGAVFVQTGTANILTSWLITSTVTTVGTDALNYSQSSSNPSNLVTAVSPGVGLAHFAGSTQTATSSAVTPADATGNTSGSGNFCLVTNCAMTTPNLGTPSALVATNITGIPAAAVPAVNLPTPGATCTFTANSTYCIATTTATITVPVPAAGYQFCVANDDNVATVITLSAIGSSARYEGTARTAYGTAGTGTFVSGGAVGDFVCLLGRDSTHYLTLSSKGTWTAN